ncbi:MAG TPA: hypothetical protein VL463_04980 [Kofleriaceae bacterium]|jgi:hypothetical protein|nr:hypothetical protein [Kofleriaceae bacterium]
MKRLIVLVILVLAPMAHADNAARQACVQAMNADPQFAKDIVKTANEQADAEIAEKHLKAADQIATNEKHVILAYAAMWLAAAGFVIFLWKRQQGLKDQIARLQKDLELALKDDATPDTPAAGAAKAKTKKS